jgi:hypothetical protein
MTIVVALRYGVQVCGRIICWDCRFESRCKLACSLVLILWSVGSGLSDGLITLSVKSYQGVCVWLCVI